MKNGQRPQAIHISWHIAALCGAAVIGIALSVMPSMSFAAAADWLPATAALALIGLTGRSRSHLLLLACAGLLLGLWRGANEHSAFRQYVQYAGKTVSLHGTVSDDANHGDKGDTRLQLKNISLNGRPMHGKVWISSDTRQTIKRNDTVTVQGKLADGFGNLAASMNRAQLTELRRTSHGDTALRFRDRFAAGIRRAISEPQASLGSGFLVGQHSDLPGNLTDELRAVGLTHAVVASGSNLTIMVGATRRLFLPLSKYTATLAGALLTGGFMLVTGFNPSMTRAGLVTGLSLAAWYYGRRIHPFVLLALAAGLTTLYNPSYVWGDIGWYLSFGSFAGVLVLAPLLQSYFWGKDYKPNLIMEVFIGTVAAQVATLPVILLSFGTYSSYALLANMLVVPLIPLAMLLTFVAGVSGVVLPATAGIVGWPAAIIMKYMTAVIGWTARLPGAQGQIPFGPPALIASYTALILGCIYMYCRTRHSFRHAANIVIGERA